MLIAPKIQFSQTEQELFYYLFWMELFTVKFQALDQEIERFYFA